MDAGNIYISAAFDPRDCVAAAFRPEELVPFQPLLGIDAQIARFLSDFPDRAASITCVAAPEIYSRHASDRQSALKLSDSRPNVHVRFGTLRDFRLLRGARNIAFLAGGDDVLADHGKHPFASGTIAPHALDGAIVLDDKRRPLLRLNGGNLAVLNLPIGSFDPAPSALPQDTDAAASRMCIQTASSFDKNAWRRTQLEFPETDLALFQDRMARGTAVLLPWNLSHPGSIVPHILEHAQFLYENSRLPIDLWVLPYNDSPVGMASFIEHMQRWQHTPELAEAPIFFVRPRTRQAGAYLARQCARAWIDPTDPEWKPTIRQVHALGLPFNLLAPPPDAPRGVELDDFDAPVEVTSRNYGHLTWRTRSLSSRNLAALARQIAENDDNYLQLSELPDVPDGYRTQPALAAFIGIDTR